MKYIFGLCENRHQIDKVNEYIFNSDFFKEENSIFDYNRMFTQIDNKFEHITKNDTIDLYVTGLTTALVAVINYCNYHYIRLTLYHYDKNTGGYRSQNVHIWPVQFETIIKNYLKDERLKEISI